jgi:hypothetical protein
VVDRAIARRQAEDRGMFVARWPSLHPLDIFTPSIDFSYEAARTRVRRRLDDRDAWFLSAEGIAIFKLLFFRGRTASISSGWCRSGPSSIAPTSGGAWSRTSARTTSGSPYGMR